MPAIVYRIIEVLSVIVMDLPIGTNLGLVHLLWTVLSGRLLESRGAIIPALSASGLPTNAIRRAWATLAYGAWDVGELLANFQGLVSQEGRWHRHGRGSLRPVAVDYVGFFRPRLKGCATKHYTSQAGKALPAIPFEVLAAVGSVGPQTVPVLRANVRAPDNHALLATAHAQLASDEYLVADRGFSRSVAQLQAAQVDRYVLRVAQNFTARRAALPAYAGRGRRPTRGALSGGNSLIQASLFQNNAAGEEGGGLLIEAANNFSLNANRILDNQAVVDGGGIYFSATVFAYLDNNLIAANAVLTDIGVAEVSLTASGPCGVCKPSGA